MNKQTESTVDDSVHVITYDETGVPTKRDFDFLLDEYELARS